MIVHALCYNAYCISITSKLRWARSVEKYPSLLIFLANVLTIKHFTILSPMPYLLLATRFTLSLLRYSHLLVYLDKSVNTMANVIKQISGCLMIIFIINVLTPPLLVPSMDFVASLPSTSAVVAMRFRHVKPRNGTLL